MQLVSSFEDLVRQISWVMTTPTAASFLIVLAGWLFARRHTVTGALVAAGEARHKHHSAFHRVFATARWSLDAMGLALLALTWPLAAVDGTVFLVLDDTLARKRGRKVYGVGMHHDPLISSRGRSLVNWGHSWVILSILVRLPLLPDRWFALPVLFRLYHSKQTVTREGGPYRTRPELAVELLHVVAERHPGQPFHVLGDATYSGQSVVKHLPKGWNLTGRLHPRAALYAPPPAPQAGMRGRRRKRGERLSSPVEMLAQGSARVVTLDLYGRHERARLATVQALWYVTAGSRLLRIVAVEPLSTGRPRQAFYSTVAGALPVEILGWFARRWAQEVTIHEAKQYLGFEEPQGWTRRAVERTAPVAMLLYSLIVLWFAGEGHRQVSFPNRPWYRQKHEPSFADMLAALRRACLRQTFLQTPVWDRRSKKIIQSLLALCSSAA